MTVQVTHPRPLKIKKSVIINPICLSTHDTNTTSRWACRKVFGDLCQLMSKKQAKDRVTHRVIGESVPRSTKYDKDETVTDDLS